LIVLSRMRRGVESWEGKFEKDIKDVEVQRNAQLATCIGPRYMTIRGYVEKFRIL
jgi:hypothetical protein